MTKSNLKLSIVVPIYNVEEYLPQCLDSLVLQTLTDIEIICVDDGSTDASLEIAQRYSDKYDNFTVIATNHIGTGACRNMALDIARGEYIGFIDPDDFIENTYFEKLYTAGKKNNADVVCQTTRIEFDDTTKKQTLIPTSISETDLEARYNIISESAHLWSKIFKRSFIETNDIRNATTRRSQDLLFSVPAVLAARQLCCIDDAKYFYRKGHKSVCQSSFSHQDIQEQCGLYKDIITKVKEISPNMLSLVLLKQSRVLELLYNQISKADKEVLSKYFQDSYAVDFDVNPGADTRIALKIPAPDTFKKIWWGDYWLGLDLITGLKDAGCSARIDYAEGFEYCADENVNIVMRGPKPYWPTNNGKLNIMYMISCYNKVSDYEINRFDAVLIGSKTIAKKMQKKHKNVFFVPQFTNTDRFFPEYDERYAHDVLFVGNAYAGVRPVVGMALEKGIDISVYGNFWKGKIDDKYIKGVYIDNSDLHKYYSSAKINLNDTTETMKNNGFISNRIYDVTACGGFLISDYIPEIEDVYGDAIPMYKNATELKQLIEYYLAHPKERQEKALRAHKITVEHFSHKNFAQWLKDTILKQYRFTKNKAVPLSGRKHSNLLSDIKSYVLFPYYWLRLQMLRK